LIVKETVSVPPAATELVLSDRFCGIKSGTWAKEAPPNVSQAPDTTRIALRKLAVRTLIFPLAHRK
jgi:hypothetical protein